jgi:hypothetical protein
MARPARELEPSPSILHALRSVQRRLRLRAALEDGARAAVAAAAASLVGVYLWRLGVLSSHGLGRLVGASVVLVAAVVTARALRRIPLARVAKQIDASHQLHDRLGSALAFTDEPERTPFMDAAIADAVRAAGAVAPRRAAPIERPDGLGVAAVLAAAAMGVAILQFPERGAPPRPRPPTVPRLIVDHDALEPEREAVRELAREAEADENPELKELARQLDQLLEQLDQQELTRKQVFDQLAELEKKYLPHQDGSFEDLKRALRRAGSELGREKLTKEAGAALAKEDLAQAKKELEKLAAEAERLDAERKKNADVDKQREELARALERTAQLPLPVDKTAEEKKREAEERRLKEEERRLKKELAERPNDRELQRRLERNQRELQRLERQKQARAAHERLQRLNRELQKAAEQLRQKLSPEAAEALRKAAQQLGEMQDEIRKLGNGQRAQVQIAELKEVLRRVGRSGEGKGDGQSQQANGGAQPGQRGGPKGQRQNGQGRDGEKALLREFNNRAGGKSDTLILGEGDQRVLLPLGGNGDQPGPKGEKGQNQPLSGDGIGDQHDPNLMGDATKLAARRKETRVQGRQGAGPSRSETILGSAEQGFASRAYKKVYGDYTAVLEEVMSKERVPPGYRFYVKRYFQLIKPRQ